MTQEKGSHPKLKNKRNPCPAGDPMFSGRGEFGAQPLLRWGPLLIAVERCGGKEPNPTPTAPHITTRSHWSCYKGLSRKQNSDFVLDFTISFLHKSPKLLIRNLENKGKQNNYKWISCKNFPLVPCRNKHLDLQSFRQFPCTYTLWILMLHVCLSMPISTQLHHCFSKMVPHYVYNKC